MANIQIYHNSRCSKSRDSFNYLTDQNMDFETVEYLKNPISKDELKAVLLKLGMSAFELIRKGEKDYKGHFKGKEMTEDQWVDAMVAYPKLIERPIVVRGDKAVVGRPLDKVKELLK